jgi:hypothetical protein
MKIEFVLRGVSPLLCHNPQMVDPNCEFNRDIKKLTGKRKKTDEDLKEIERLEWLGGLYTAEIGGQVVVSQPSSKVRKCLINAARISKQGKQIERAVIMTELNVPLIYEGSDKVRDPSAEIDRLLNLPSFHSRLSVGIGGKRVMRVRPQFKPWALVVPAEFITDAGLNLDELKQIADLAGRAERIGDNRVNGYGSFVGIVRAVTPDARPVEPTLAGVEKYVMSQTQEAA